MVRFPGKDACFTIVGPAGVVTAYDSRGLILVCLLVDLRRKEGALDGGRWRTGQTDT